MRRAYWGKKTRSFSVRIFVIFMLMFMILVFIMSTILYRYFYNTVEDSVKGAISNSISANEASVQSLLNRIEVASDLICDSDKIHANMTTLPRIFRFVNDNNKLVFGSEKIIDAMRELQNLRELLKSYVIFLEESGSEYECILYIDDCYELSGVLPIARPEGRDGNDVDIYSVKSVNDIEWYRQIRDSSDLEFVLEYDEDQQRMCMYKPLVCKYIPPNDFNIVEKRFGIMYVSFDMSLISYNIVYSNLTEGTNVFLIDKYSRVIFSDKSFLDTSSAESLFDEKNKNMKAGVAEYISYNGETYVMQYNSLTENIGMVTVVPNDDILKLVKRTISVIVIMAVVFVGCGIIITLLLSKYVIRPVKMLSEHMEKGHMEKIDYTYFKEKEIETLYIGFNQLVEANEQLIHDVRREADEKRRAERRILQAQINPHFVYNTLDVVCGHALLRGETDIVDILFALSQIMRYNTKRPDDLVTLSKEIDIIKLYEVIQTACYEDGLSMQYELDSEVMNILVPKMIIQPLVENAILHGMNILTRKIEVKVVAYARDGQVVVEVVDTGTDAPIDKMNNLLTENIEEPKSDGIGIKNVYERIQRVYGEQGSLAFLKNEDGYTVARITIYIPEKNKNYDGYKLV